jgi:hypothetical protein
MFDTFSVGATKVETFFMILMALPVYWQKDFLLSWQV